MATFDLDDVDADALRRMAAHERRSVDDLATEAVREFLVRRGGDLSAQIERARADADFTGTLARMVERDREILDRLAE